MSFVGLHTHSDYSLLDGASQLPQLVGRAVELGMPAIALTDHGVMYGAIELIKVCRGKGVKPIIGNEMYVVNDRIKNARGYYRPHHQVVLAKNNQGYKNLVKLTTKSHLRGMQGKGIMARPCITKEQLAEYREGLIVTSGCLAGEVPRLILNDRLEEAKLVAEWYKDLFGDDYYLEIQDHGSWEDRIVNVGLVKIGRELGIKIVATNDSHFTFCTDVEAHDALLCVQTGQLISEEKRMRYSGTEYLKSAEEMAKLFRDHLPDDVIQEAISNTLEVASKVEQYNIMDETRIPNYPKLPPGHTADTYVEEKAWEGLLERMPEAKSRSEIKPVYKERLEYELKMIQQMGFSSYFLVVWDYIKYARDNGIPVGPGRGSAAGSLVAYSLRITNIDPVHHGLLFERFLNPERKSMPDIDTDFCVKNRDNVIEYVTREYGEDRVAQIITFNRMTSKAVLKDVARVLDIPYAESDKMAKLIPVSRGKPEKLLVMISDETPEPEFKKAYDNEEKVRRWLDMALRIEGTNKSAGVHAAGVIISAVPLDEIVPLQRNEKGAVITQYPMEDLESLGLLKMDFLGLKNLTMLKKTVDLINKTHRLNINPELLPEDARKAQETFATLKKLPEDVEKAYKVLEKGELEGIFQLESSGMRQIVRDLKPSSLEDISSILALYRPGPLDAGLIPLFISRKHGREPIKYQHPLLEPILQETYAVLVYQEQIMKVAQDLAGYSLGQADILRRCLSGSTEIVDCQTGRLVTLSEIAAKPEFWLGRKVFSLDVQTQKISQQPISEIHPNGVRDVWEVTTKTNRKIKATDDHLFYTLLGWKPLKAFRVGDRIGLAKTLPIAHASDIPEAQIKLAAARHRVRNFAVAFQHTQLMAIADSEVFLDEIASIEYAGKEEVFDLTIAETHNFIAGDFIAHNCMGKKKADEMQKQRELFLDGAAKNGVKRAVAEDLFEQMVKFAEYCFNKSHSTAYAYVTYQTAYLKGNYPVEYMAALLTSNSEDQDKVKKYIANCLSSGIEVEPPDINRSEVGFTPLTPEERKIIFGLSAVKNLGEGAIKCILKARNKGGAFKSLADLCDRVDLRTVNSRALESLIKCGALDKLNPNRQQLIEYLKLVIPWAQNRAKDKEVGQGNLFDWLDAKEAGSGGSLGFEAAPKAKPVEDFPQKEKLKFEKELLGFYVSDHPLKFAQKAASQLRTEPVSLSQLDAKQGKTVKAIVMLTDVKHITTKKGERMARLQMEDLEGKAEAVVFPQAYEQISELLKTDEPVVISGRVEKQDDRTQLLVEKVERIDPETGKIVPSKAQGVKEEDSPSPGTSVRKAAERLGFAPVSLSELDKHKGKTVFCAVTLTKVKQIVTKNGEDMAFLQIENFDSQAEAVVFPRIYASVASSLVTDASLLIWGKVEERQEKTQVVVENAVRIEPAQFVTLELTPQLVLNQGKISDLQMILQEYSGDKDKPKVPVLATVAGQRPREAIRLGHEFWVQDCQRAVARLNASGFPARISGSAGAPAPTEEPAEEIDF
jgi:DNA-directed DNA polymerase III PolC